MEQKSSTTDTAVKKKSIFSLIKCWFSKEEPVCGGGPEKAAKDASESKDGKVCSNGEIRL
jgi:hypothetical protein